jgi:hypothetical protein
MRWVKKPWGKIRNWWRRLWKKKKRPGPFEQIKLELVDMDIRGIWALPTARESGGPLPVEEIARTIVDASIDGGTTWAELDIVDAGEAQELLVTDAEIGTWHFRATVIDTGGRASTPLTGNITVPDQSNPGPITDFSLTLV